MDTAHYVIIINHLVVNNLILKFFINLFARVT